MPRSQQSRESGIISYFKTAELPIAEVVLGLAKEAVAERKARSTEARDRALAAQKKTTVLTVADRLQQAADRSKVAPTAAPKKAKKRKRASRAAGTKVQTAKQIEAELEQNDGAVIEGED